MRLEVRKLNLARRYLWGALVAALMPLVIMAALYDRYSAILLDNLIENRVNSNLEAVAAKMSNFMAVQVNRLENIVDLPATTDFFTEGSDHGMADLLSDFLLLETENPDIYAIELASVNGDILQTIPATRARTKPDNYNTLPQVHHGSVELLGPVLPDHGRPGWFLVRMPVYFKQEKIGVVSLRMRLASLTEQAASLIEPDVYEPEIVVFDRVHLSVVGTEVEEGAVLAKSRQFFPGWRIHLVEGEGKLQEPRVRIRYILMIVAALSAVGLIFLFFKMSERLSRYLIPLNEAAEAIANGNFAISVSEDGPGELGMLARSYNRMREQLESLIKSRVDVERRAALGNMAAGIAHEIRNPLATVATTIHGLNRGESDPERHEMYEVISSEITRVDKTIGEFLKYAKPSAPVKERVLIREVFRTIRTLTATPAHEKNTIVNLSGDSGLEIKIDQTHLRQILLNLTLNAIEAMPDGGHLTLQAFRDDGHAQIIVSDNGIGLDEDTKSKILRPFFTTRTGGSGLGLSVTSQLVETNDGIMIIESEPGQGTTVTMRFPITGAILDDPS